MKMATTEYDKIDIDNTSADGDQVLETFQYHPRDWLPKPLGSAGNSQYDAQLRTH